MDEGLVSCIVPVRDGARFLDETLQSIYAQTYRPLEIIVVDDGSADGTPSVIAAQGARVSSLRQAPRGQAAARNAGVTAARGTWLAFLDADDLWEPDKIARQVAHVRAAPEIDLCFTRFRNFWEPELEAEAGRYRGHAVAEVSAAWSVCTLLASRHAFHRFGLFDEALRWPNLPWFLHAAGRGARIEVLGEVLARRRLHRGNATRAELDAGLDPLFPLLRAWRDARRRTEAR